MPRRKRELKVNPDNLPIADLIEVPRSQTLAPAAPEVVPETSLALPDLNPSNRVLYLREDFENKTAEELELVRSTLHEILRTGNAKEQIMASKLILQVNGLLEKKTTVDAESISNLVAMLTKKSAVKIRDVTNE